VCRWEIGNPNCERLKKDSYRESTRAVPVREVSNIHVLYQLYQCDDDDDDHDRSTGQYQEGGTTITEHSKDASRRTNPSRGSTSERSEVSSWQSLDSEEVTLGSSETGTSSSRSAASSASSTEDRDDESYENEVEIVHAGAGSNKSHTRFRAPEADDSTVPQGQVVS